jgi:transposase-like protein
MKRVPPSARMKEELDALLRGETSAENDGLENPLKGFVRGVAQYMLQVTIEDEVTEFLGRGRYQRGARSRAGLRNGYERRGVQSEVGLMELQVPQLRSMEERFRSPVVEKLGRRTEELEQLVRGMYVRGLSTQDVSDLYRDTFGASRLSKSTVSRVTQKLNQEFDAWKKRDLSELKVVYLFLDGQYHAARQGSSEKEGVLSAYAILEGGQPVLLHLDLGPGESYDAWLSFLQDMTGRGLGEPLLVIFDGAPGLKKAIRRMWPRAYRQRCQVHKMRNILSKLPRAMQGKMKKLVKQVFLAPTYEKALTLGRSMVTRFRDRYPSAMECLEKDLEETVTYLLFPMEHHKRIRTTNRLERLQGEGRRRSKVIPRFPSEASCLSLMYATLITASRRWRGIRMTTHILRKLDRLRVERTPSTLNEAA